MTTVYSDTDFNNIRAQKLRIFHVFLGITAAYLVFCLGWLIYYISLPYADPMQSLPKWMVYIASVFYVAFIFPFMGIKYHRVRRYYKMMYYLSEGLKNTEENYFVCFESKDLQKDYVDATACIFKTWNRKKSEWMEREAYFDNEKPLPDFHKGDLVKYIVQSNFIVQYEIVEREALDEEDEYEEYEEEAGEEASEAGLGAGTGESTEKPEDPENPEDSGENPEDPEKSEDPGENAEDPEKPEDPGENAEDPGESE